MKAPRVIHLTPSPFSTEEAFRAAFAEEKDRDDLSPEAQVGLLLDTFGTLAALRAYLLTVDPKHPHACLLPLLPA